jgi:hypothetical protein
MVCDEGEKNIYILHRHDFGWGWGEVLEVLSSVEVMGIEGHQIWVGGGGGGLGRAVVLGWWWLRLCGWVFLLGLGFV